jgi:deazaflavin-dependent oxidoreductase (nitroreductase family)
VPYTRPPLFVRRVFNPLAMRFRIGGSQALTVAGRRTGRLQRVPVIPVDHDGARYLVSPRGETDWARNLRAAGTGRLGPNGAEVPIRATEVPVDARADIITAYRAVAGRAVRSFFTDPPDPANHPVFHVEHTTSDGSPRPADA